MNAGAKSVAASILLPHSLPMTAFEQIPHDAESTKGKMVLNILAHFGIRMPFGHAYPVLSSAPRGSESRVL